MVVVVVAVFGCVCCSLLFFCRCLSFFVVFSCFFLFLLRFVVCSVIVLCVHAHAPHDVYCCYFLFHLFVPPPMYVCFIFIIIIVVVIIIYVQMESSRSLPGR